MVSTIKENRVKRAAIAVLKEQASNIVVNIKEGTIEFKNDVHHSHEIRSAMQMLCNDSGFPVSFEKEGDRLIFRPIAAHYEPALIESGHCNPIDPIERTHRIGRLLVENQINFSNSSHFNGRLDRGGVGVMVRS